MNFRSSLVQITLEHLIQTAMPRVCVFWDVQDEAWSDFGCEILEKNVSHTQCSCAQLAPMFAILALPEDPALVGNGLDFGLIQKKEAHKDSTNTVITVEIATYLVSSICLLIIIILLIQVSFNSYMCDVCIVYNTQKSIKKQKKIHEITW